MYLHPNKTKVMVFGTKRKLHNKYITIKYNDVELENTDSIEYLGVVLDSQLLWNDHIHHVRNKICLSIGCIRRIKHLLPRKILVNLYYSLILPHIDYCCTAWGSCSKRNIIQDCKIQ